LFKIKELQSAQFLAQGTDNYLA